MEVTHLYSDGLVSGDVQYRSCSPVGFSISDRAVLGELMTTHLSGKNGAEKCVEVEI